GNCGASIVWRPERTTTMSVIAAPALGGNACASTSFARCDCGLFVGLPSVVSAPPRSVAIAAPATTTATIQAPTVRHGCRALDVASCCVGIFLGGTLSTDQGSAHRPGVPMCVPTVGGGYGEAPGATAPWS